LSSPIQAYGREANESDLDPDSDMHSPEVMNAKQGDEINNLFNSIEGHEEETMPQEANREGGHDAGAPIRCQRTLWQTSEGS
jgi:hypothetical protein